MSEEGADDSKELVESKKRVAADGSQRGLKRLGSKNRRTKLIEQIQEAVKKQTGVVNWDPLVMMSIIAVRAATGYEMTDDKGDTVLDGDGKPVMVPPDLPLAVAASAKVAPYVHQQLRPKDTDPDDSEEETLEEKKERILTAFESIGVKVKRKEEEG